MHHSKEKENSPIPYEKVHFVETSGPVWNYSIFTEEAIKNFQQGTLYNAYQFFGNKQLEVLDTAGTYFAVWAPNATKLSIVGNFNNWQDGIHPLFVRLDKSGIWEGFIPGCKRATPMPIFGKKSPLLPALPGILNMTGMTCLG